MSDSIESFPKISLPEESDAPPVQNTSESNSLEHREPFNTSNVGQSAKAATVEALATRHPVASALVLLGAGLGLGFLLRGLTNTAAQKTRALATLEEIQAKLKELRGRGLE